MKNTSASIWTAILILAAFTSVSFTQTTLSLEQNDFIQLSGEDKTIAPSKSVDFKIALVKGTRACIGLISPQSGESVSDGSPLEGTFDGSEIPVFAKTTPNEEDIACFDIKESRSFAIKLTNTSEQEIRYVLMFHSSTPLEFSDGIVKTSGTIAGPRQKHFTFFADKSKVLCITNRSSANDDLTLIVSRDEGDEELPLGSEVSFPLTKRLNVISVTNNSGSPANYNFTVKNVENCENSTTETTESTSSSTEESELSDAKIFYDGKALQDSEVIVAKRNKILTFEAKANEGTRIKWDSAVEGVTFPRRNALDVIGQTPTLIGVTFTNGGKNRVFRRAYLYRVEDEDHYAFVPPDGVGGNRFVILGKGIKSLNVRVFYNGAMVYQTDKWTEPNDSTAENNGWDGSYGNGLQVKGKVSYRLSATYINGVVQFTNLVFVFER